jgi:uncharacterized membrane protein (DUF2068 family)
MSVVVQTEPKNAGKSPKRKHRRQRHSKGLLLVALFKLTKAIFFGAVGIGALHLLHRDVGELVMRIVAVMPFDPEGKFVSLVMDRADLIGNHQLKQVGLFALAYSCVCVVEGTGLYLEKTWAEYFTVTLTVIALPWEIWELFRQPTLFRFGLLGLNLLVLAYLIWVIQLMRKKKAKQHAS